MEVVFKNYFNELVALIGMVVWLIRIEGKTLQHTKEIDHLDQKLTSFDSKILSKLSEIAERLSYIEGALKAPSNHDGKERK